MKTEHNNPLVKGKSSKRQYTYSVMKRLLIPIIMAISFPLAYGKDVGNVKRIVSGDTIEFFNKDSIITEHIKGIDAPEPGQPFFNESKTFLEKLISERTVELRVDELWCEGAPLNEIMVEQGYAWFCPKNGKWFCYETVNNDRNTLNRLADFESKAKKDKKGLWAKGTPVPPWEYRRSEELRRIAEAEAEQRRVNKILRQAEEQRRIANAKEAERQRIVLEKYESEQIAKNLVKYNGDWMTPEQRNQRIEAEEQAKRQRQAEENARIARVQEAERQRLAQAQYEAEQTAKGLVKYNGYWLTPEQRSQRIDAEERRRQAEEQVRLARAEEANRQRLVDEQVAAAKDYQDKVNAYNQKVAAYNEALKRASAAMYIVTAAAPITSGSVIESTVDGTFNGWNGETIVKLINGQIWQQTEYHYHYHYAYRPDVLVYNSGGVWKMKVTGVDKAVGVKRLR
ncbi:MAG: hypothetical protein A2283_16425 [Lentisphaerae bacterium RIFOXYA12_FULL_48_11]|nr:MAG: hypothetical protein A2283_16425 [Lentisphaerae bacterium RIFOXYA12_FULL_48_11]